MDMTEAIYNGLMNALPPASPGAFRIVVPVVVTSFHGNIITEEIISFNVRPTTSIQRIQHHVRIRYNLVPHEDWNVSLHYNRAELARFRRLHSYGITHGAVLYCHCQQNQI